jgi:hypothetical protein
VEIKAHPRSQPAAPPASQPGIELQVTLSRPLGLAFPSLSRT